MNKYQKLISLTAATAIIGLSTSALAADNDQQPAPPSKQMAINHYGVDAVWNFDENGDSVTKTYAGAQFQITDNFRVNAAIKLEEAYGAAVNDENFDWQEAVAEIEGVITIKKGDDGSETMAVVIFGKSLERTLKPRLEAVKRSDMQRNQPDELEETLGVAIDLTQPLLDSLRLEVSEVEGGDMKFNSDRIRMTVKAHKALSPKTTVFGSLSYETGQLADDDADGAGAISIGVVHDLDAILDGLEVYGQITHYQKGYGSLSEDMNTADIGLNYYVTENWALTGGVEITDSESMGREYIKHLGASYDFGNNTSAYVSVDDRKNIEFGATKKW